MAKVARTPLEQAKARYDKQRGLLLGHMKGQLRIQSEKDDLDGDLDEWVRLHPNFPLSELRKSRFGNLIKWGRVSVTGTLDPIAYDFWAAHRDLHALERYMLASWKK